MATLHTWYTEGFDGSDGVTGAPGSATDTEGQWSIDATGTNLLNGNDFARESSSSFALRDLGGNSEGGSTSGTAIFSTLPAGTLLPGSGYSFLTMTMTATLPAVSAGSMIVIESFVNGGAVADVTTVLTTTGTHNISHDLRPYLTGGDDTYELRITVTQDISTTYFLGDILVQGNSAPEPASLSMLGMGVLAMCGVGYRRRRKDIVPG